MMILKLVSHFIILVIWFIHVQVSAQDYPHAPVAKPGCDSQCGDLQIPFPFGMNASECYLGKWFEIECRNTSTYQTPYLKSIELQVVSIDVQEGTVTINNPIYRNNCGTKDPTPVNRSLEGSPFVYSQEHNKFVAAGCDIIALLQINGSEGSGCVSICDEDLKVDDIGKMELKNSNCNGKSCCQNSLPAYLKEYSTEVKGLKENERDGECSYAMVVQEEELNPYEWDYVPQYSSYTPKGYYFPVNGEMKDLDVVPVVLEWEILNSLNLKLPPDDLSHCFDTNITSSLHKRSGQRCSCPDGSGNPYVDGGCLGKYKKENIDMVKYVGVSTSFGSIILLLILWRVFKVTKKIIVKKFREKFFKRNGGLLLQQKLSSGEANVDKVKIFSLKELEKATDNFNSNRVLGKGGQATVYKGMLIDGTIIAVKKFKVQGKIEEFINEFVILSQINHRNVVKLLGSCLETKIPLLVYEFIPNGNLFDYLHQQNKDMPLTWEMRLRIAIEVAGALFYLHSAASQPIYHKDIKSTNILLDEKYRAKVADFGTSRMISIDVTHLTTVVQGTFGYLDPEFFQTSQFTEKSDVYSFGVVLVELLTGQKPVTLLSQEEAKSLASYFIMCVEKNCVFDIIDERVMKEGENNHIMKVVNLASRCLELNGKRRPTMREITLELEAIRKLENESNAREGHDEFFRSKDYQSWDDNSIISEIMSTFDLSSRMTILKDVHTVTM
ncbi:wall-associated receptor kinase-like 22 [Vigna radiata var. radiata]|uniref:Wall-associated receptor kinase-like 22 n=1 Tax=Vigna radiata var. radiata TaxID=3916 RepID=A0A3Q0FJX4_VIGRR|nr:wall-associated receptor kinase-like 22 [Vigna radiata var. radiata]